MATPEYLKESLEHFKQQRQAKIEELRILDITIRHIQQQVGETPEPIQSDLTFSPFAIPQEPKVTGTGQSVGANYKPRADEFFGVAIGEAAKAYLEKVGHAVLVEDILRVITSGGCKVGGADPKRTLAIMLLQNKREFVSTGGGNFGLRKFYPNMPKLGRPEASAQSTRATKSVAKKPAKRRARIKLGARKPTIRNSEEAGREGEQIVQ
ncbi:MAG: hypothetical protein ABI811_00130 [Acidobacteriota bacterium]